MGSVGGVGGPSGSEFHRLEPSSNLWQNLQNEIAQFIEDPNSSSFNKLSQIFNQLDKMKLSPSQNNIIDGLQKNCKEFYELATLINAEEQEGLQPTPDQQFKMGYLQDAIQNSASQLP